MQTMSVKKQILRALAIVLALCSIAVMFTGCGNNANSANAYRNLAGVDIESQVLASDSISELSWDSNAKAVVYKTLENGAYWSDILYDSFLQGNGSANGNSPISITVVDTKTFEEDIVTSYSQKDNLNIQCKKIENGIRVIYFFSTYKIAIPLEYTLENGNLRISIITKNILEDGTDYKLRGVSIAPYLCTVPNGAQNGHLLVPTGTGALMSTAERAEGMRTYTGEMFGEDAARRHPNDITDDEAIRLPAFGAYGDGRGIMGIIDKGAGSVDITAQAGNDKRGYSNIYPTFNVRGYDSFEYTYHGEYQGIRERVNENITTQEMSVVYYTLYGADADYNGMAKKYRDYLNQNKMIEKSSADNNPYSISFWGGTTITKSILGIPKEETIALTSYSKAEKIVKELEKQIGSLPAVRLYGYGDRGVSPGIVAGGKKYPSVYGSKKELASLVNATKATDFFVDSDIVNFSKSGAGFSVSSDSAKTAVMYKAELFKITPVRVTEEAEAHYAIQRGELFDAANIVFKKAKKNNLPGVSFSTLGTTSYSDYTDDKYISKGDIDIDVKSILNTAKENGYKTAVSGANSYAACAADAIFDVPVDNGLYSVFDKEIPFYQLVFHSYKPMYSNAVNLYENVDYAIAKSMAYGMGLGYAIIGEYEDQSDDLDEYRLYAMLYEDNKEDIHNILIAKNYKKVYSAIADSQIESYVMAENGVSTTTYSNGVKVYVNHTKNNAVSPAGELAPYAFSMS